VYLVVAGTLGALALTAGVCKQKLTGKQTRELGLLDNDQWESSAATIRGGFSTTA
jgi:hypothetical protein